MIILPAIYTLNHTLKQSTQDITLTHSTKRRYTTPILNALFVSILAMVLISLILDKHILLFTGVMLVFYLLVILTRILRVLRRLPVNVSAIVKRIIAGTTVDVTLFATSKVSMQLHCLLNPVDSWIGITPQRFILNDETTLKLNLTITPPLAGPTHPQLLLSTIDPWGFTQVNQVIEPMEVHVIPRAAYAEWLAKRYLEQIGSGSVVATVMPPEDVMPLKRGVEYLDSRTYQPGDQQKDIDWKHSLRLNELIVKRYTEPDEQVVIIAVNLSVADAEEADKLAFNMITTALTLAHKAIPAALAIYNHERVVATTAATDPRETLKQALLLVEDITTVEFPLRLLQPPDINRLRRNIMLLKQVGSQSGGQLLNMLEFEYKAVEEIAKKNSATLAILRTTKLIPPPATIALVSQLNYDAEAVLITCSRLSHLGFETILVGEK